MPRKKPERSRFALYRDALRGGPPRELAPCGTWAAVRRHERKGEPLDALCQEARNEHARDAYAKRKAAKVPPTKRRKKKR